MDFSQSLYTRSLQANPSAPAFTHKLSKDFQPMCTPGLAKEGLWHVPSRSDSHVIDGGELKTHNWSCTPGLVKQGLLHVHSRVELRVIDGGQGKLKTHNWSWKMLSLEQAFASMDEGEMLSIDDITYLLWKCRNERNLDYTTRLHAYIRKNGLESCSIMGNYLVPMLVDVGRMCEAEQVFNQLMNPNQGSWNALIAGYVKCGDSQKALILHQRMHKDVSLYPNGFTFVSLLRACAKLKDLETCQKLHNEIMANGLLEKDALVGNTLVDVYAKCGSFVRALAVFDKLPTQNVVSWTTLIAAYVEHGHGEKALKCLERMKQEGIEPNAVTFLCGLKACGLAKASRKGQELHEEIANNGLERDLLIGSTLVSMYAKCGLLSKSHEVLHQLQVQNVVSWNALIAGYVEHGQSEQALACFKQMQHEGVSPDAATFVCSLKACVNTRATEKGRALHAETARTGFEGDLFVGSTLVDLYAKCGLLCEAQEVFNKLAVQNVVSWTTLIGGYAEHGQGLEALRLYEQMQQEGVSPNVVTLVCILKACGSICATGKGQCLHAKAISKGLESNLLVGSTLVDMYSKFGMLTRAQDVFDRLKERNVVSWTALIGGYAESEHAEEAISQLEQMQQEGVRPNAATFVCSLKACSNLGFTDWGRQVHAEIARKGLETDPLVGCTLLDMYAKCGAIGKAQEVFDKLSGPSVISWNVLIAGYAQVGESESLFDIFDRMVGKGVKPNLVTFVNVLHACSHAGLVEQGQAFFELMSKDFGIVPTFEHQSCMVDLLGRAGQLDKAIGMVWTMQIHPDLLGVWGTVLSACRKWGNLELGRHVFRHAICLDETDSAAYVCMSNICADFDFQKPRSHVDGCKNFGFKR